MFDKFSCNRVFTISVLEGGEFRASADLRRGAADCVLALWILSRNFTAQFSYFCCCNSSFLMQKSRKVYKKSRSRRGGFGPWFRICSTELHGKK